MTTTPRTGTNPLAAARENFLTSSPVDVDAVRDPIIASWWRSKRLNIAADNFELPYVQDPNQDTPLVRCATPVLKRLREQLQDAAISIILTDKDGVVLERHTPDARLKHKLDRVQLAPGFSYAERFAGTNGIGTALEGRKSAAVFGHEHYVENLDNLGCAGVPIRHPTNGQVLGVIDLTCWSRDAGPLLMALAENTAEQIERELTTQSGIHELALFEEYLRACRQFSGMVFALNHDVVMMNDHTRDAMSPDDQAAMLGHAAEAIRSTGPVNFQAHLPSGARVRLLCTPVHTDSGSAGGVVRARAVADSPYQGSAIPAPRAALPGIVGSSALWQRAAGQLDAHCVARDAVILEGEPGVGKLALIRAVHRRHNPAGALRVIDAGNSTDLAQRVRTELDGLTGTLALVHVDRADQTAIAAVSAEIRTAQATGGKSWIVATSGPLLGGGMEKLLDLFPHSVEIPPLRHHIDDLRELVPFLLVKLSSTSRLSCSAAAMQILMRGNWPGNITQLRQILRQVIQHQRAGIIRPDDLPPECRSIARRVLNPLESLERDAIVQGLLDSGGNKNKAARALGMSRATIYRKIRDYGIDLPN